MKPAPQPTSIDGPRTQARPDWKSVAVPNEHGGWGLTLEPVLLGLLVAPTTAGVLLGLLALFAFVARTPLKITLIDSRRGRRLDRTTLAQRILAVEVMALAFLAVTATVLGDPRLWLPVIVAGPLVALELWFDARSRSRRLIPELAGAMGVSSVAAMIVLADEVSIALAAALWMVLAARAVTSIPFVRSQVGLLHGRETPIKLGIAADAAAVAVATFAVLIERSTLPGAALIGAVVIYQRSSGKRPPDRAAILGVRQTVIGLTIVLVTALSVLAP